jgi:hypothetical protein
MMGIFASLCDGRRFNGSWQGGEAIRTRGDGLVRVRTPRVSHGALKAQATRRVTKRSPGGGVSSFYRARSGEGEPAG